MNPTTVTVARLFGLLVVASTCSLTAYAIDPLHPKETPTSEERDAKLEKDIPILAP